MGMGAGDPTRARIPNKFAQFAGLISCCYTHYA